MVRLAHPGMIHGPMLLDIEYRLYMPCIPNHPTPSAGTLDQYNRCLNQHFTSANVMISWFEAAGAAVSSGSVGSSGLHEAPLCGEDQVGFQYS